MNENNIEQIERLLYSDEDFEKISSYANKEHFNIFRINILI